MTGLRLVRPQDVEPLRWWATEAGAADDFTWVGYQPGNELAERVNRGETISDAGGRLAVCVSEQDDTLIGDVEWRRTRTGASEFSWCWNIGIGLLPQWRGQGHGTAAQRLLASYLFDHTTAERIEADTEIGNIAEQKALERAGFSREGVMRRREWRAGQWHDMVLFSKLRGEA